MNRNLGLTALAIVAALACSSPAIALDSTTADPQGAAVSLSGCSLFYQDYTPDMAHQTFNITGYVAPSFAANVLVEVTVWYADGRPTTELFQPTNGALNGVKIVLPRYTVEPVAVRCAIAFASLNNQEYVAPWLPIDYPQAYASNPATPISPVPAPTPTAKPY